MKKVLITLLILPLFTGCYAWNNGIPLFNSHGYHYTPKSVEVQKGDTLYSLSQKYKVPLRGIIEENRLSAPYALNVGQILKFPVKKTYTVAKGDTLYGISKKYDVDVLTLSRMNGLEKPYALNVGQVLEVPDTIVSKSTSGGSSGFTYKKNAKNTKTNLKNNTSNKKYASKTIKKQTPRKAVSTYRKSKFIWPVNGTIVSNFGTVGKGLRNDGINIKAALGTNVKAADKGIVAYAGNELKGFGNLVLIKHSDGYITAYAHIDKLYVKKGQKVIRGEKIATVGNTGSVKTPQLHFEVRAGKKAVNPKTYLP